MKEIDGVAVSEGRVQESRINEINAEEEDSGEKGGDRQRRKAAGESGKR